MNNKMIELLEAIKTTAEVKCSDFLNIEEIEQIQNWYNKFSNNTTSIDIDEIIDLMYYLYVHENIDFYPVEQFQTTANYLCNQYQLDQNLFLEMLQEFRKILFSIDKNI